MPAALAGNGPTRANALTPAANAGLTGSGQKGLLKGPDRRAEADSHGLQLGQTSHKSNRAGVPLDGARLGRRRGYVPRGNQTSSHAQRKKKYKSIDAVSLIVQFVYINDVENTKRAS